MPPNPHRIAFAFYALWVTYFVSPVVVISIWGKSLVTGIFLCIWGIFLILWR
jgi:hypothetical protein